jgi:uncharacterized protein YfaP (DUF2135 family)
MRPTSILTKIIFVLSLTASVACGDDPAMLGAGAFDGSSNTGAALNPNGAPAGEQSTATPGTQGTQTAQDAALTVTMKWNDDTDLDLHLIQPNGEEVYYRNRETDAGARFSKDSCIASRCESGTERVEEARYQAWAPGGTYRISVVNYDGLTSGTANIEVSIRGEIQTFTVNVGGQAGATSQEVEFEVEMMDAPCMVNVEGYGMVDLENDYIPNVVACENGDAPPEALKAAAIMARGFVYYKTKVEGATVLRNSEADQVYRCSYRPNGAGPEHFAAAAATTGVHPTWRGNIIAPFYVAGNVPPRPNAADPIGSCKGTGGSNGLGTEGNVTYNYGKFDCDITMSSLGWVTSDCTRNAANRGAASQNGQSCLANFGWGATEMLEFYYGADIEMTSADYCAP